MNEINKAINDTIRSEVFDQSFDNIDIDERSKVREVLFYGQPNDLYFQLCNTTGSQTMLHIYNRNYTSINNEGERTDISRDERV